MSLSLNAWFAGSLRSISKAAAGAIARRVLRVGELLTGRRDSQCAPTEADGRSAGSTWGVGGIASRSMPNC